MNRYQKLLVVVLMGCVMGACGPKGATTAATDQSIATDIQAKLAANDATRAANVKVAVVNGVVMLSGDVPSSDAALQAMTVANNTTGIKSVSNQMRVVEASAAAPLVQPPMAMPGEPERAAAPVTITTLLSKMPMSHLPFKILAQGGAGGLQSPP